MKNLLAMIALLAASVGAATGAAPQPLAARDVAALVAPPATGQRIIMLWSLDCVYCEPNMEKLAALARAHPQRIELVTVATDPPSRSAEVATRLAAAGMQGYPAWVYAEAAPQRLNFLIDPNWGGELPRTIVIDADGTRRAFSGLLGAKQLKAIAPAP